MNKLGSEFLRVFDNYERPILFGRTKRQLVFFLGLFIGFGLMILFWYLKYPDILTYIMLTLILFPTTIYGVGKDKEWKERYLFRFTIQERSYMTHSHKERNKMTYDFTQRKGTKEADES